MQYASGWHVLSFRPNILGVAVQGYTQTWLLSRKQVRYKQTSSHVTWIILTTLIWVIFGLILASRLPTLDDNILRISAHFLRRLWTFPPSIDSEILVEVSGLLFKMGHSILIGYNLARARKEVYPQEEDFH